MANKTVSDSCHGWKERRRVWSMDFNNFSTFIYPNNHCQKVRLCKIGLWIFLSPWGKMWFLKREALCEQRITRWCFSIQWLSYMRKNLKQNLHFKIQSSIFGSLKQIVNVYKKYVMKSKFKRKRIDEQFMRKGIGPCKPFFWKKSLEIRSF